MYVVCLNGPPRSGKDTIGNLLNRIISEKHSIPTVVTNLAYPLRKRVAGLCGVIALSDVKYEEIKDSLIPGLPITVREAMIEDSEKVLKPRFGKNIFSQLLINRLNGIGFTKDFHGLIIIRDSGFQNEVDYLEDYYGRDNLVVAQVHREGRDFTGDSREWVEGSNTTKLFNGNTMDIAETEANRLYGRLVNNFNWKL